MAAEGKSDREPLPRSRRQGLSQAGFFRRFATVFKISCESASSDAARASYIASTNSLKVNVAVDNYGLSS
jgi:hypothetical protein